MYKQKIYNFIKKSLNIQYSAENAIMTFIALILIRLGVENWIADFSPEKPYMYFYEFLHTSLFFLLLFIMCVFFTTHFLKISLKVSLTLFLFSFIIIILPPIFDWIISSAYFNGISFKSYYLFDSVNGLTKSFGTFFGDKPRDGITYGTRIIVFMTLIFFGILTWIKTKKLFLSLLVIVIAYVIFFIMSSLPSIIAYVVLPQHLDVAKGSVAGLIASPSTILGNQITNPISAINIKMSLVYLLLNIIIILFIIYKIKKDLFVSLAKNIRPIQTIYHIGLLIIGMYIAVTFGNAVIIPTFFTIIAFILLCIAIIFAWYSTVILNDCVDEKIDAISNPTRPLITKIISVKSYKKIGFVFMLLSIILALAINGLAAIILIVYHALSFIYNTQPLRLKRFPFIASLIAAVASFFVVTIGFVTITPDHSMTNFPPHIAVLLIIAYTISLPIKDLKDIKGDKANNIYTIPVIFGENISRTLIAISIFSSFMLSIFTLGTKTILIPALFAGALSFWTLVGRKKNQFIFSTRQVIPVIFCIVCIYSIILAISLLK